MLKDPGTEILLSAASSWEISIKWALGKLPLPAPPARWVPDRMQRTAVTPLPVTHGHALGVALLPKHHNDPFDRMLIAQAIAERSSLMTADPLFSLYDVDLIAIS